MLKTFTVLPIVIITCHLVYCTQQYFMRAISCSDADIPFCAKKFSREVKACVQAVSGLPVRWIARTPQTLCCYYWVIIDCATEKARDICTVAEWEEEKIVLDRLVKEMEANVCMEYQYKPYAYSDCKEK